MATSQQLENWFTHHPPMENQPQRYQDIREAGKRFANLINEFVPASAERDEAIKAVRSAVMWANAGIACNETLPPDAPYAR